MSNGISHKQRPKRDMCVVGDGQIFSPIELAMEAAKAKVIKDFEMYRKIRPFLVDHRGLIEAEMLNLEQYTSLNPK